MEEPTTMLTSAASCPAPPASMPDSSSTGDKTPTEPSSPLSGSSPDPYGDQFGELKTNDTGSMSQQQHRPKSPFTPTNASSYHKNSLDASPPAADTANEGVPVTTISTSSPCSTSSVAADKVAASDSDSDAVSNSSLSDVEMFNGKIVYNPDGSAYIIEAEPGTEMEAEVSQEGSIVDAHGLSPRQKDNNNSGSISFPQIVSAFHISRNNAAGIYSSLFSATAPMTKSSKEANEGESVVHSYRVFSCRSDDKESLENGDANEEEQIDEDQSVPVKPILMCFICKLSFGYTKSFIAHAVGEQHQLVLNDQESRMLGAANTSAIIQGVGKEKQPLISFLKPKASPAPFCSSTLKASISLKKKEMVTSQQTTAHTSLTAKQPQMESMFDDEEDNDEDDRIEPMSILKLETANDDSDNEMDIQQHQQQHNDSHISNNKLETLSANDLHDLANFDNLAKFANFVQQHQQQQQHSAMDLQSIAAVMAVAAANQQQQRTPSPKHSPPKNNLLAMVSGHNIQSTNTTTPSRTSGAGVSTGGNSHPPLLMQHSRNSCKTLKCPKCNWHYKYQETLEIHMKEKHPENEMSCIYCLTNQAHPRLARGETYTCGYKPYRCDVCNYSTTTKGNLSIHMQSDKHINNVQELQNGNIPATAEHLLQSQAFAAAVAQATGNGPQSGSTSAGASGATTGNTSGSPSPSSNLAAIAAAVAAAQQEAKMNATGNSPSGSGAATPTLSTTPNGNSSLGVSAVVSSANNTGANSSGSSSTSSTGTNGKQKATWRCDVCNYETNVARNLRIHMTSEKHTHNILVLKQNVTQMQQLTALQQAGLLTPEQLLQFNPMLAAAAAAAAINNSPQGQQGPGANEAGALQPEAAIADLAYNHALLMMASQQQQQQRAMAALMQQHVQQQSHNDHNATGNKMMLANGSHSQQQPTFDLDHPDPSMANIASLMPYDDSCRLFHCLVCSTFTTDSLEELAQHIQCDRSVSRAGSNTSDEDILTTAGGAYICKLCTYKTPLKANFQLHCKTDKHLQRLQHYHHIKEGGAAVEWKLKFINVSNTVQIRCNVCDHYTNSLPKLQMHMGNPRHEMGARIYSHLQQQQLMTLMSGGGKQHYYHCSLCSSSSRTKVGLIQHLGSVKHLRNESLRQLKQSSTGTTAGGTKDNEEDIRDMFLVKEMSPGERITFDNGKCIFYCYFDRFREIA